MSYEEGDRRRERIREREGRERERERERDRERERGRERQEALLPLLVCLGGKYESRMASPHS